MSRATRSVVAIDLGASSGRVLLARWDGARGSIAEVHRFANAPFEADGHLLWDVDAIWREACRGIAAASRCAGGAIDAIGVDGWAADYALLDAEGERVAPVFCYRDARNAPAMARALVTVPRERLYASTGVQFLPFNTLYQLLAHRASRPEAWARTRVWLNLPEYFLFRLSGVQVAEYTNATHTQMVDCRARAWAEDLLTVFALERAKFPPIVPPGTVLGPLRAAVAADTGAAAARVIAPACHDTGSAVAGLPFTTERLAFISSGTWSLVGTVLDAPVVDTEALAANFTNEGGVGGTIRFLKNVIGLWLLQACVDEWRAEGHPVDEPSLAAAADKAPADGPFFDADNERFLAPGHMISRINAALDERGYGPITDPPALAAAIFRSLARRYAEVIAEAAHLSGRRFEAVVVAGGGVKNRVLNRLTREFTGLPVVEGPVESAAIGNAAVQIGALEGCGSRADLQAIALGFASGGG